MAKVIKVVTTKPELNQAEYAVEEDGVLIRHGERIDFAVESLSPEQQQKLADARAVLLELATDDAVMKGLV